MAYTIRTESNGTFTVMNGTKVMANYPILEQAQEVWGIGSVGWSGDRWWAEEGQHWDDTPSC